MVIAESSQIRYESALDAKVALANVIICREMNRCHSALTLGPASTAYSSSAPSSFKFICREPCRWLQFLPFIIDIGTTYVDRKMVRRPSIPGRRHYTRIHRQHCIRVADDRNLIRPDATSDIRRRVPLSRFQVWHRGLGCMRCAGRGHGELGEGHAWLTCK